MQRRSDSTTKNFKFLKNIIRNDILLKVKKCPAKYWYDYLKERPLISLQKPDILPLPVSTAALYSCLINDKKKLQTQIFGQDTG
jgi:hypothetical protein